MKTEDRPIKKYPHGREAGVLTAHANHLCVKCRTTSKRWQKCPECQQQMISLGVRARVPKKSASEKEWRKFFKLFKIDETSH